MILFVCESNSSMSPMAESIFRDLCPTISAQSAGRYSSHIRQNLRQALREDDFDDSGLYSKDLFGVDLKEVSIVIGIGLPDASWRLPRGLTIDWWAVPDPSCFPAEEQMDAYRALRDELRTRIGRLIREEGLPS